jgi:multidrug efflux system membrane fusion protein
MTNEITQRPHWRKIIWILVPILIGIIVFFSMSFLKKAPRLKAVTVNAPTVRVINIAPMDLMPRAFGYGTAEPIRVWKAIAQVSGKIIYAHPQLQKGKMVKKGTVLLRIDPSEYKIIISQLKTKIQSFKIQIKEQQVQEKNNLELLKIQKKTLAIKKKELARQKKLYEQKMLSINDYETQLQGLIAQEAQVQSIQNGLNLIPLQRQLLTSQMEQGKGDLANAQLQLSYTEIRAPFAVQIASVNNKSSEFVQKGQTIFEANDTSAAEIEAQFSPGSARPVFMSLRARFETMDINTPSLGEHLETTALVRIPGFQRERLSWQAELNRFSDTMDTETRTMGLIFVVKNKMGLNPEVRKRPLVKGMFCEVELQGKLLKDVLVIPRSAVHPGNTVYLLSDDKKLVTRVIEPRFTIENLMVVRKGLKAGETLILSDVIPAVSGTRLDPVEDKVALKQLMIEAQGAQP